MLKIILCKWNLCLSAVFGVHIGPWISSFINHSLFAHHCVHWSPSLTTSSEHQSLTMERNSNKPMMRDTATSPRVLLETEKPSLYQSPSNHGQAMEGRGFDLGIHFHQWLSHCVWRWHQYYHRTTHTQHEGGGRRDNGISEAWGMSCFVRFYWKLRVTSFVRSLWESS